MIPDITPRNAQSLWVDLILRKSYSGRVAFVHQAGIRGSVRFHTILPGSNIVSLSTPHLHSHGHPLWTLYAFAFASLPFVFLC